jgi:hypothetical protein
MAVVTDIFPNFASALAACGQGYYNDGEIADALSTSLAVDRRQFTPEQAINSILAAGVAAAETTGRPLTVLDFGGGCGRIGSKSSRPSLRPWPSWEGQTSFTRRARFNTCSTHW